MEPGSGSPKKESEDTIGNVARRIRNVIAGAGLDCACRNRLEAALNRFAELESDRARRRELLAARQERQRIDAILQLLGEIEELTAGDDDPGVFLELALLFDDIAESARGGAAAMRALSRSDV